ncbi:MAG: hypothetical protein ACNA7V_02260 [Bacteroidales bacterium]
MFSVFQSHCCRISTSNEPTSIIVFISLLLAGAGVRHDNPLSLVILWAGKSVGVRNPLALSYTVMLGDVSLHPARPAQGFDMTTVEKMVIMIIFVRPTSGNNR